MMLPYLEQNTIYNACNFSWNCWYGTGEYINSTAFHTKINSFLCPSDGIAGSGNYNPAVQYKTAPIGFDGLSNINNYIGSLGTSTNNNTTSTGLFAMGTSFGIQNCTDGTSNTIAFSEGLVSGTMEFEKWRDGVASAQAATTGGLQDANQNIPGVMADLQLCNQIFQSGSAASSTNDDKGYRWGTRSPGITYFNTIVPPTRQFTPGAAADSHAEGAVSSSVSWKAPAATIPAAST